MENWRRCTIRGNLKPMRIPAALLATLVIGCSGGPADPGPPPPPPPTPPSPAPVTSVTVALAKDEIVLNETTTASATLRGSSNQLLTGRPVTWSSSVPTVATVADGLVVGVSGGTTQITATSEGVSGSRLLRVDASDPNLILSTVMLTQAVQRLDGDIPLVVGGHPVLVNVLARYNRPFPQGVPDPLVRIEVFSGANPVLTDERPLTGQLSASVNAEAPVHQVVLPASIVQPGLRVRVRINPGGLIPEPNLADNVWPAAGTKPIPVQAVPSLPLRFIPIQLTIGGSVGTVTPDNLPGYLTGTRQRHPVSTIDADIGSLFSTDVDFGGGQSTAWIAILQRLDLVRVMEGSSRYYVGALRPPPGVTFVQFGGWGYIPGNPASTGPGTRTNVVVGLGWFNRPSQTTELVAHELAHNMGRLHAPCGAAAGPDPGYPYPSGVTGAPGHDLHTWSLTGTGLPAFYSSGTGDLMGYCNPPWVSDYTYLGLLAARGGTVTIAAPPAARYPAASACPCLMVWGSVHATGIRLEPSFVAPPPAVPTATLGGSFRLRAIRETGAPLEVSFEPADIDHAPGERHFAVAIPLAEIGVLQRLEVTGQGRSAAQVPSTGSPDLEARTERVGGSMTIRWNRARAPLVILRDPASGRVVAIGRSGMLTIPAPASELELIGPGIRAGTSLRLR